MYSGATKFFLFLKNLKSLLFSRQHAFQNMNGKKEFIHPLQEGQWDFPAAMLCILNQRHPNSSSAPLS
jgi:hypothetical protein